jgi:glycosyltransferase involved in cell wall biosynthesis
VIIGNFPIIEHNSANKFFDSLSAGKPVLLNYSGWQRKILESNEAGFGCTLCNLDEFVEKVLYLNSHRKQVEQMGQNARQIAVETFDRDQLAKQALELTSSVIKHE